MGRCGIVVVVVVVVIVVVVVLLVVVVVVVVVAVVVAYWVGIQGLLVLVDRLMKTRGGVEFILSEGHADR